MAAEDFFTRWSKKKTDVKSTVDGEVTVADVAEKPSTEARANETGDVPEVEAKRLPTQDDVDKLTHDSDYSTFMSQGVDESVKRSAMKKLFTDPHFNIMDGLDIYIDDYNKFEPMTPALLASLDHAKALLDPLSQLKTPLMRLLEKIPETKAAAMDDSMLAIDEKISAVNENKIPSPDEKENTDYAQQQICEENETLPDHAVEEELNPRNSKAKPDISDV